MAAAAAAAAALWVVDVVGVAVWDQLDVAIHILNPGCVAVVAILCLDPRY